MSRVEARLRVEADGTITALSGKIDYGQGLRWSYPRLVVEEERMVRLGTGADIFLHRHSSNRAQRTSPCSMLRARGDVLARAHADAARTTRPSRCNDWRRRNVMILNEGVVDRAIRIVVGLALLALVFVGPRTWLGLIGVLPLASGFLGYRVLHVSTCRAERP